MSSHGRLHCRVCWKDIVTEHEDGRFRIVNDPGHWGATNPTVLVLGMSKGRTQSAAIIDRDFDDVAFKGMRVRLRQALQTVGIKPEDDQTRFEKRFSKDERDLAFASVTRCSVTGWDQGRQRFSGESSRVIPAFRNASTMAPLIENCISRYIMPLAMRTRLILLLSNDNNYIRAVRLRFEAALGPMRSVNEVAFQRLNGLLFVHIAHPSPLNGSFQQFVNGIGGQGRKRDQARDAIASHDL